MQVCIQLYEIKIRNIFANNYNRSYNTIVKTAPDSLDGPCGVKQALPQLFTTAHSHEAFT